MANQLATIHNVDLQSVLSTNKNKNIILPFTGFSQRHNPFLNESLKTLNKTEVSDTDIVDKYGNLYTWNSNGKVYKNGEELLSVNRSFVKKTVISIPSDIAYIDIRPLSKNSFVYVTYDHKVYYYNGSSSTLLYTGDNENSTTIQLDVKPNKTQPNVKYISIIEAVFSTENNLQTISSIHVQVYSFTNNTLALKFGKDFNISTTLTHFQVGYSSFYDEVTLDSYNYIAIRPVSAINQPYNGPENNSSTTVPFIVVCLDNNYEINTTINERYYLDFDSGNNYLFNVDYIKSTRSGVTDEYIYNEYFTSVLVFSIGDSQLTFTVFDYAKTPIDKIGVSGRPVIAPEFKFYSNKILVNDYLVACNRCWGIVNIGDRKTATFKSTDLKKIIFGGGCSSTNDTTSEFSRNYSIQLGAFSVVFDSNNIAAISLTTENKDNTLLTPWLSVKTDFFMPYLVDDKLFFHSEEGFCVLETTTSSTFKLLYNRYILFYTNQYYNMYDTVDTKWIHFASDWNNRILIGQLIPLNSEEYYRYWAGDYSVEIASGVNVNYNIEQQAVITAIMQPRLYYNCINFNDYTQLYIESTAEFDFYISKSAVTEAVTVPAYTATYKKLSDNNNKFRIKNELTGVQYPIATDGNIVLNPSMFFELYETSFQMDYIKEGLSYYTVIYNNGVPYFIYAYGSQLNNINQLFILQGQPYVLRNNTICAAIISNNLVTSVSSVISCANMQYLGASVSKAYFYSAVDKYIYVFMGDRNLQKVWEMSEINSLYTSYYSIDTSTFYILTDKGCYAIVNDEYVYLIEGNFKLIQLLVDGFVLQDYNESKAWKLYRYYGSGEKEPVQFTTSLYGYGDNRLSIIDCWYIRLYSDTPHEGNVTCSVVSVTDKGTSSEEKTFHITPEMWDKLTNTYYLRFQPKYQRSVGSSLKVVSDFDVYDLKVSATPDTAIQVTKPVQQVITGGKI